MALLEEVTITTCTVTHQQYQAVFLTVLTIHIPPCTVDGRMMLTTHMRMLEVATISLQPVLLVRLVVDNTTTYTQTMVQSVVDGTIKFTLPGLPLVEAILMTLLAQQVSYS